MQFRTELNPKPSNNKISVQHKIITIGSCFSDKIGHKLNENKFNVLVNPFGIVYNPISIFRLLTHAIDHSPARENGFIERDGIFFHYDFHSSLHGRTKSELNEKLNSLIEKSHQYLKQSQVLIITLGTAMCYEHLATKSIVANCHKIPQCQFSKFLLSQKTILTHFEELKARLERFNPELRIILTVSPVRHIKDTIELNSVSKSTLRIVCDSLENQNENVKYFPAYEIMLDDLRDYRFYKSDLLHPTEQAVDYIWEKFTDTYFDSKTKDYLKEWNSIKQALQHKPFNAGSESHQKFLKNLLSRLMGVSDLVDVNEEQKRVSDQITST